ncbi:succinate dehydrogenase cytochrome b subunit [bacterium]|nr:succinate dehydrogenase cytochrome b subunit [bacterium]
MATQAQPLRADLDKASCFFSSSIGLKFLMGITGIGLVLFIIFHLLGNLQIFLGQNALNEYAELLEELGGLLWIARIGLIAIFLTHVISAIKLKRKNTNARPVVYAYQNTVQASFASRVMFGGGSVIFFFVLFHLAHFTWTLINPEFANLHDQQGRHDVFSMVVLGFSNPIIAFTYILALTAVCLHLSHGIPSFLQSLGFYSQKYTQQLRLVGPAIAGLIYLGYISIPIAVLLEIISLPPGVHY